MQKYFGKKIGTLIEIHGKRDKGEVGIRGYHSTVDHLVTFRIIAEECCNDKNYLLYFFVDFRKSFDTMPRTNL